MRLIPLTQGMVALVDEEDYSLVSRRKWRVATHKRVTRTYCYARAGKKQVLMHRLIIGAQPGQMVDHINGDGLDNRRCNLRICTNSQNQQNRRAVVGISRYKGVTWHKRCGKWQVQIKINGRSIYLGLFDDELEAARAYAMAAQTYFGDFACTHPHKMPQFDDWVLSGSEIREWLRKRGVAI